MTRYRILCIRTDRLGETILTLPVVTALQAAQPHAELVLLVHPELAGLLNGLPGVAEIWPYEPEMPRSWQRRALKLASRLRAGRFDLALVCHPKKELHAAVWLAGIPRRVGYARKWGWCLTDRVPDRKRLGDRHEVECNLDLVRRLGDPVAAPAWRMPAFDEERLQVQAWLRQQAPVASAGVFIAVHPWSSNPLKQWPADRYRQLIGRLAARATVVILGGAEARACVSAILPAGGGRILDLVGRTSLRQLAAVLQEAVVLVSNDSGPVHLAAALGTATVALFGGQDPATGPGRWGPWGPGHTVISRDSLEMITVEDVLAAVDARVARAAA